LPDSDPGWRWHALSGRLLRMIRWLFRTALQLLLLVAVVLVFTAVWIVYDGLNDTGNSADCAVVLGAAIRADGQPAEVLRERLDRAVQLYRDQKVANIIVSGADHVEGHNEADGMAAYLKSHGVPAKAIIEDHGGTNTDGTARGTAKIMRDHHFKSVMIVTHYYHITRTKMALKREGVTGISQVHAGTVTKADAFNIAREVVDIYYHLVRFYLGPAAAKASVTAQAEAVKVTTQIQSETHNMENNAQKAQP
jgi:vancomycin permeability regulator SanA